jgi:selenocysteine-specific elongation factor
VQLRALPALASGKLKQRARLHVHHAAREVLGRLDLLEQDALRAGETGLARLHLEEPLIAKPGDRIVLRSYSPMLTVAGATVLDPSAPRRQKRGEALQQLARMRELGVSAWPAHSVVADGLAGTPHELLLARFAMLGIVAEEARSQLAQSKVELVRVGDRWVAASVLDLAAEQILARARRAQADDPLAPGLGKEEVRGFLRVESSSYFQLLLSSMMGKHPLFLVGDRIRADAADAILDDATAEAIRVWEQRIREATPAYSPSRADMQEAEVKLLVQRGSVVVLDGPLLADREMLEAIGARACKHFRDSDSLSIADVKEWTQGSRKYVVPILEWLDQAGYTRFDGKLRTAGPACD